jgi:predicted ATPase
MRIGTVYVRFYRAFNYDFLAKHRRSKPEPWDLVEPDLYYPFIDVELDEAVTCVVGANESGKSQLLTALEMALSGEGIEAADFCRYSAFFAVDTALRTPQFGLELVSLSAEERAAVLAAVGGSGPASFETLHVFRFEPGEVVVYLDRSEAIVPADPAALMSLMPRTFRIDPEVPIPNSLPIAYLAGGGSTASPERHERWALLDPIVERSDELLGALGTPDKLTKLVTAALGGVAAGSAMSDRERHAHDLQLRLGYDLLVTVGGVHPSAFQELERALRREDEGFANGVIAAINTQLSTSLKLTKWWTQDAEFNLQVAARDYDLVFTVRDRTSSEYSFAERSSGLKYFLSYLVQYLAREAEAGCPQVLLMDEPDAFLSNQGQQDLLKIFHDFTREEDRYRQVVFVTHSPFLIDKNRADRIRVLDKGSGDEGTRVVRNVGHNHFEPLRSSLGGFMAETAFIGNCNLMLEGVSDQIYLAGMSAALRSKGRSSAELLDLNSLTLVAAGSAQHVPYMVYLARGRDTDQPAVVALLDGDSEGVKARKALARGGAHGKQLLAPEFILQLGDDQLAGVSSDRPDGPRDIEDLVPVELGLAAAEQYLQRLSAVVPAPFPDAGDVKKSISSKVGVLEAIQRAVEAAGADLKIEKVGFARHVVELAREDNAETEKMADRFAALFIKIGELQRAAERERSQGKVEARVERLKNAFLQDHPDGATRADLKVFLEDVEARLDGSLASDRLLVEVRRLREEQLQSGELADALEDFPSVRAQIEALQYVGVLTSEPPDPISAA